MTMMTSEPSPVSLVPPAQPGHFARPKLLPYHHHHHHQIRHQPQHTQLIHSPNAANSAAASTNVNRQQQQQLQPQIHHQQQQQQQQQHSLPHEPTSRHSHQGNSPCSFGPSGHPVNASPGKTVNLVILPSSNESSSLTSSLPTASTSPASSHPWLEPGVFKSNIHLPPCKSNINHGSPTMAVPKKSPISPPLSSSSHASPSFISSIKTGPGDVSDCYSFPISSHSSVYQYNNDRLSCSSNLRSETRVRDSVDWSHLFGYPNELTSSTSSSLLSSTSSAVSSVSNEPNHLVTSGNNNIINNSNSNNINKKPPTGDRPHLHALHRLRREIAKGLASSCRVLIRDNSNRSRPSLLALGRDFFCRFADREKIALSSFDFLDEYYTNDDQNTSSGSVVLPSSYFMSSSSSSSFSSPNDYSSVDQENYCIDYTYLGLSYLNCQLDERKNQFTLVNVPGEGNMCTSPSTIANECDHEDESDDQHYQNQHKSIVEAAVDVADGLQSVSTEELNTVVSSPTTCDENEKQQQQQQQQQQQLQLLQEVMLNVQPQMHQHQQQEHSKPEQPLPELDKCDVDVEMKSSFKSSATETAKAAVDDERERKCTRQSVPEEPFVPYLLSHPNCVNPFEGRANGDVQDEEEQVIFEATTLPSESFSRDEACDDDDDDGEKQVQHQPEDTSKHLPSSNDSSGSESCDLSYAITRYHQIEYLPGDTGVTELADDLVCLLAEYNTGNESNDVSPLNNFCLSEVENMFQGANDGSEKQVKDVEQIYLPYVSPPKCCSSQSPSNFVDARIEENVNDVDEVQVNLKEQDDTILDQCQDSDLCDLTTNNDVQMELPPLHHQVSLSSKVDDEELNQVLVHDHPHHQQQLQSTSTGSQVAAVDGRKDKGKERSAHYSCNRGKSRRAKHHRQRRKQQQQQQQQQVKVRSADVT